MKNKGIKSLIIILLLAVSTAAWSNPDVPPAAAQKKLQEMYPGATQIGWQKKHGYKARFILNNKTGVSEFNKKGELRYYRVGISYWALPMPVLQEVKHNYVEKGYKVNNVSEQWYKGRKTYDVQVVRGEDKDYILRYYPNGRRSTIFNMNEQHKIYKD